MADPVKATAIREAIAARLRTISIANDSRTDIGAQVFTEPTRWTPEDGERITVYPGHKMRPDDARSHSEREYRIFIEALLPVSIDTPAEQIEAVEADIEDALKGFVQMPMALPALVEESVILDRPEGIDAMALQMTLVTRYR